MENLIKEIYDDYVDVAAELGGLVEILNTLQLTICQFDGSETDAERNSAHDSLYALTRSLRRFEDNYRSLMHDYYSRYCELSKFGGERPDPMQRLEELGIIAARRGMGREWVEILERHCAAGYADMPLDAYRALEADLTALLQG